MNKSGSKTLYVSNLMNGFFYFERWKVFPTKSALNNSLFISQTFSRCRNSWREPSYLRMIWWRRFCEVRVEHQHGRERQFTGLWVWLLGPDWRGKTLDGCCVEVNALLKSKVRGQCVHRISHNGDSHFFCGVHQCEGAEHLDRTASLDERRFLQGSDHPAAATAAATACPTAAFVAFVAFHSIEHLSIYLIIGLWLCFLLVLYFGVWPGIWV